MVNANIMNNKRLADGLAAIVLGFAAFWLVVGMGVLDVTNIRWLTTVSDTTTHYLGWVFFRNDVWRWPLGLNPNYGLEFSSSVIFSDSVPLMALLFKLFSGILPAVFQYSGWWLLACFLLQAFFAIRLLRLVTQDPWVIYIASVFFVFSPPMLWRLGGHFSLVAHWLVLGALLLYFNPDEQARSRPLKWAALLAVSAIVHTYLFAMILPLWGADIYRRAKLSGNKMTGYYPEVALGIGAGLVALWIAGFFPLRSSYLSGGYGVHRVNLLALFNPHGIASIPDQWSYIIPAFSQGEGDYEGFNYLGLGGILLFAFAIGFAVRYKDLILGPRLKPLAIVCLLLTLFAVTNHIGFGGFSLDVWLPKWAIKAANVMRASGRFFWPVYYLLLLGLLWLIVRSYPRAIYIPVVCVAAIAQVVDTKAGWAQYGEKFSLHSSAWPETVYSDKQVLLLASLYPKLRALPAANANKDWDHRVNLALTANVPTDVTYLARANDAMYAAKAKEVDERLTDGRGLEMDSLYFLNRDFALRVKKVLKPGDRIFSIADDVYIYAPDFASKGIDVSLPSAFPKSSTGASDER